MWLLQRGFVTCTRWLLVEQCEHEAVVTCKHGGLQFDGDGMIHALRMKSGKAYYSNQWVETSRLKQERKAGHPLFPKVSPGYNIICYSTCEFRV
jgi:hypothetical protein